MLINEMELFHKNYQKLKYLITQSQIVFEKLNLREENLSLKPGESFRLLVMGRNRKDRIDLFNSLVEREFLNTTDFSTSTTDINVKWDDRERAAIHFINDLVTDLSEENFIELEDEQRSQRNMLQIEVPVSKLHKYIPLNKILDKIEIYIPDSFCIDGIEMLDVPEFQGTTAPDRINEAAERLKANLVIAIISCDELEEADREGLYKSTSKSCFNSIFYIIKAPEDISTEERCSISKVLKEYTRFGEEGLFFIPDLQYSMDTNESTIHEVRQAIHQEHRRESLFKPLYDLTRIIKETIFKIIGELYKTAERNAQDAEMLCNRSTAAVRRAQLHRENIQDRMIFFMERIKNSINEETSNFIDSLPGRILEHMEGQNTKQSKNPVNDAYKKIEERIDMEMYEWITQSIVPLIDAAIKDVLNEEGYSLKSFCYEIDNINRDFSRAKGIKQPAEKYIPAVEKFSQLLKIGEKEELKEYIKSINESLISKVIFSKRIFVINSGTVKGSIVTGEQDILKCCDMVYNSTVECIRKNSDAARAQISDEILSQIEAFFEYIKVKINFEIERVQKKVEYLQEYKRKLQSATDRITECEKELKQIDNELIELLFETMGT